uniref:Olfactory receptor n=1 Tax=Geotrypetes seraphini TaxID=260995 RepID=A0A6P8P6D5_GEOSA|nr:olfactory receptor 1S1-like [Geotrypetes seraphini]
MEPNSIGTRNQSFVTGFVILGFKDFPEMQLPLFLLFSLLYLMAVFGNLLIICIVCADRNLHTPMYFFLANLSVIDIGSLTNIIPELLVVLLTNNSNISFSGCILQMYCYIVSVVIEFLLLTVMAYDRYMAICNPLHYAMIMNKRVCALLAAAAWITGFLEILPYAIIISQFSFCHSNIISHFFCEITALLKLSCTDIMIIQYMTYIEGVIVSIIPFLLTLISYIFIISTILKIRSTKGKSKAFSTCSSHLMVFILLYGTLIGMYLQPDTWDSKNSNKLPNAIYIVTLPLLNPLIYSLRSKELRVALKKAINRKLKFMS